MAVFVAGHRGMVGSAIVRQLQERGETPITRARDALDLTNQTAVQRFMQEARPDTVILAADRRTLIIELQENPGHLDQFRVLVEAE